MATQDENQKPPPPFECCLCPEKVYGEKTLLSHYRTIHLAAYDCYYCGAKFITFDEYEDHALKEHGANLMEGGFQCEICKRVFKSQRGFNMHKKSHRQRDGADSSARSVASETGRAPAARMRRGAGNREPRPNDSSPPPNVKIPASLYSRKFHGDNATGGQPPVNIRMPYPASAAPPPGHSGTPSQGGFSVPGEPDAFHASGIVAPPAPSHLQGPPRANFSTKQGGMGPNGGVGDLTLSLPVAQQLTPEAEAKRQEKLDELDRLLDTDLSKEKVNEIMAFIFDCLPVTLEQLEEANLLPAET